MQGKNPSSCTIYWASTAAEGLLWVLGAECWVLVLGAECWVQELGIGVQVLGTGVYMNFGMQLCVHISMACVHRLHMGPNTLVISST